MASCCAGVITPSISCLSRWRICWICCRLCCIESDEFAHTASTCWRACCVIIRRCCMAAFRNARDLPARFEPRVVSCSGSGGGPCADGSLGSCVLGERCRENEQSQQCRKYSLVP